jgi:hypothetical protein
VWYITKRQIFKGEEFLYSYTQQRSAGLISLLAASKGGVPIPQGDVVAASAVGPSPMAPIQE